MTKFDRDARPKGGRALASWYAKALAAQRSSGLSVSDFAERLGVSAVTLYQWRRRLEDGTAGKPVDRSGTTGLVEVTLREESTESEARGPLVLRLPGSRVLEVPSGFDERALVRLLEVLAQC